MFFREATAFADLDFQVFRRAGDHVPINAHSYRYKKVTTKKGAYDFKNMIIKIWL